MANLALDIQGIGKRYNIGLEPQKYKTLRESLTKVATAPVRKVRTAFGPSRDEGPGIVWALKDVSFQLQQGQTLGIVGPNGAGKSTLLKILSRITEPTQGFADIYGRVGTLLEVGSGFHNELTGRENIYLNGAILGMKKREIERKFDEIIAFSEIEQFIDTPVKRYSSGMYMRLAFSVAAHLEPEVLLVDEVLAVGDAGFQKKCLGKMGEVADDGRTVIFVSHNMAAVQKLCGMGLLLEKGRMTALGEIDDIIDAYMRSTSAELADPSNVFPVYSDSYGVGITGCDVVVQPSSSGGADLILGVDVDVTTPTRNLGVGLRLTSPSGVKVLHAGPAATGFLRDCDVGTHRYSFICRDIDSYLNGGDYIISLWLAQPPRERLLRIDRADILTLPEQDVYGTGSPLNERRHGPLRLPLEFDIESPQGLEAELSLEQGEGAR
jgi:lipopolysaccharide transport system ATP-binding protein